MRSRIWGAFAVVTALMVGCGSDDDSGSGGTSGKGGTDGGKGGTAGKGGTGGTSTGGTSTGGGGTGGGTGGATGGTAGTGVAGMAGGGGVAGAVVKDVPCDGTTACPVQPGHCCYTGTAAADAGASDAGSDASAGGAVCQGDTGQCGGTTISCNNKKDCNGQAVCCLKITVATGAGEAKCTKGTETCTSTTTADGGVTVEAIQLCDPAQTTPTECTSGSCQAYSGSALPAGYNACK